MGKPRRLLALIVFVLVSGLVAAAPALGQLTPAGLLASATHPATQPSRWAGPFFFIQMSDSHVGWIGEPGVTGFERAIHIANRLSPAFVVVTGDLIDAPGVRSMDARFKAIAAKLDPSIPLYVLPGNHDLGDTPTPRTLAIYRQEIGPDRYSFDARGCHFVAIDSEIINRPRRTGDEQDKQLAWLKADLARAAASHPVHFFIFSHHPIFEYRYNEPDAHGNLPLARRSIYLDLLKKYHFTASLAGHQHRNSRAWYGSTEMITTASLCKPFILQHVGFCIVKVFADHIEHQYMRLDHPVDKVTLVDGRPTTQRAAETGAVTSH